MFLDAIAREEQWTFFAKREGEGQLGEAFPSLIRKLQVQDEEKLFKRLRKWLNSGEPNLIWFASEVIGYFEIEDLKDDLLTTLRTCRQSDDINKRWPTWALNCRWAVSVFDNFTSLNRFLLGTSNRKNQEWLLEAYEQMLDAYPRYEDPERWATLRRGLEEFTQRSSGLKVKAEELLQKSAPEQPVPQAPSQLGSRRA